ncbi:MAG: cupredoxin domain-containing protein [Acidimicrobiales bacterium]
MTHSQRNPASGGSRNWRLAGAAAFMAAAAVLAASCGSNHTNTASSNPSSASGSATPITVTLTEFHIALSRPASTPGTYSLTVVNSGRTVHSLEVDGPGVSDRKLASELQPGQRASLTVTLQAGSYELYCPVDGHKQLGMDTSLTVGGASASTSAPASSGSSGGVGGY